MITKKERDENIVLNLKDAGCEPEMVIRFLQMYEDGKTKDQLSLLAVHRKKLLVALHGEQAKLDCLDHLINRIRKRQTESAR